MLYLVAGEGELDTPAGVVTVNAGALAFYRGDEELRLRNPGTEDMVLLAFLAPKFGSG